MHEYHDALQGFDERQIWHDGCQECEQRGASVPHSLGTLDSQRFARAWQRAADFNKDREVGPVSDAERPLLNLFWYLQVTFERECRLPIGELPTRDGVAEAILAVESARDAVRGRY